MTSATAPVPAQRELELAGQTVVVIGGSAGIGLETARRARAEGADVILTGRNPGRLEQAAAELGAQRTAAFDASDAAAPARFFQDLPAPIDHVMVTASGPAYAAAMSAGRTAFVQRESCLCRLRVIRHLPSSTGASGLASMSARAPGGSPVTAAYDVAPSAHMSLALLATSPRIRSGAR